MSAYEALAKSVLKNTLRIKAGENVIVETWNHGLPIAAEFVYQARAMGSRPLLLFEDEGAFWRSAAALPKAKQGKVGAHEWAAMEEADAYVFITGPADIAKVREVGMEKYSAMTAYNAEWYKRAKKYGIRGARIGLGYASPERARSYGLDAADWRRMMVDASTVAPSEIRRLGRRAQKLLSGRGHVEVTAPNGTNLEFDLAGRASHLDDGSLTEERLKAGENMVGVPAGEVYVAPKETSARGTIRFDRPVAYIGRWMRGLTFAFDNGRAKWSAAEGDEIVRPQWNKGKPGKDRLGGFQIGLNPRARTGFLSDYIVAGNVYVLIGNNEEFGGKNKTNFAMAGTLTGATVTVDGTAIVEGGSIVG